MWSASSANALGALQFTNKNNNGTYAGVVRTYKKAELVKNFENGARNMHNVIKAAICLLDLELARSVRAKALFEKNTCLGAIYPVAAYNGGPLAAERMIVEIERLNGKPLPALDRALMKLPKAIRSGLGIDTREKKKQDKRVAKGIRMNTETPMYIKKYLYLMDYFSS